MLEKIRIHRAMLQLNETGGFSARDLAASTAAALPTIRKTIERAVADGLIEECGTRPPPGRGGPQKLFRLTEMGRVSLADASARIYAALVAAPLNPAAAVVSNASLHDGISTVTDDPEYLLDAALETLGALRGPFCGRRKLLEKLAVAAAELDEAAREKGEIGLRALQLRQMVRNVTQHAHGLAEDDEAGVQLLCNQLLTRLEQVVASPAPRFLDRLIVLLPVLRREAKVLMLSATKAETLVREVFTDLLTSCTAADSDDTVLTDLACRRLRHLAADMASARLQRQIAQEMVFEETERQNRYVETERGMDEALMTAKRQRLKVVELLPSTEGEEAPEAGEPVLNTFEETALWAANRIHSVAPELAAVAA